jgi:hypothetical protein
MTEEGRFFTTLGAEVPTYIPGGADVNGRIKSVQGNFMELDFDSVPSYSSKAAAHAAPTGTDGDENIMVMPEGTLEYHMLGTQTLLAPLLVATGLDVGLDQANDEGIEVCGGILASNKLTFIIGTDPAFYAKMQFSIADVTGTDDCAFGFRKAEPYQAALDDYDEMAAVNVISGVINLETILNAGTTTTTDTTLADWADGETHELEVRVSAAGVVTYKVDNLTPTVVAAFTFDDGEVVVPFFYMINTGDFAGAVVLQHFECGPQ